MIAGWDMSREPSLSVHVNGNSVVFVVKRSEMLRRLLERRPNQIIYQVRMPEDAETTKRTVPVEYR